MYSFFEMIDIIEFLPKWLQTVDYIVSENGKIGGHFNPRATATLKDFQDDVEGVHRGVVIEKNVLLVLTFWDEHGGKNYEFDILDPHNKEDVKRLAEDFEKSKGTSDQYDLVLVSKEGNVFDLISERITVVEESSIVRSKRFA